MPPLLSASSLRIDVTGVPAIDGLSLATTGEHVLVLGAARALFEASAALRPAVRGDLRVEGVAPRAGVRASVFACAPLDPRLPPRWTVAQYTRWSARLAGHFRAAADELSKAAVTAMDLVSVADAKLGATSLAVRRGTVIAAALATDAHTILVEDPLTALPEDTVGPFAQVLANACLGRRSILFAGRIPLASPLSLCADEALVIDGSRVVAQGAPADIAARQRTLSLRMLGDVQAFAHAVEKEGGRASVPAGAPEPVYVSIELGPLCARDLLRIATDNAAAVFELRPIAGAFA